MKSCRLLQHPAFTQSVTGTGGTLSGTGKFLKTMNEDIIVALSDPEGSGLYNKIKYGVMFDQREAEGTKRRHQVDTVVEGMCVANKPLQRAARINPDWQRHQPTYEEL